jgi:hypothetical protein
MLIPARRCVRWKSGVTPENRTATDAMLELISILASIALLVVTPMQTAQIRAGKISPNYKGTADAYAAAFCKQIGLLVWLGAVFTVLNLVLIFIATEPGDWIVNLVAAVLWFGVFAVSLHSRQRLAKLSAPAGREASPT